MDATDSFAINVVPSRHRVFTIFPEFRVRRRRMVKGCCETLKRGTLKYYGRKVLNAKDSSAKHSDNGPLKKFTSLDNAPRLPRGPRNIHVGTQLQGCLPKTGLGLY